MVAGDDCRCNSASGRPKPVPSGAPDQRLACDVVIVAIGQDIESGFLAKDGILFKKCSSC